ARLTDYARELTVNVGTIAGGTVLNRVPHEATAEGEFRAFSPEDFQQAKSALLALSGAGEIRAVADRFPCSVQVEVLSETRPWPRNPETDRLAALWQETGSALGQ